MKVFISWSGERSQALAQVLRERLPFALHYVEPWLSHFDIEAGDRWADKVAKELEDCQFGITCLTVENVASPWILFEAGALAKSMQEGRVVPLLLDLSISDISGPLAQFQAKKVDKAGVFDVIQAINNASQSSNIPEGRLGPLFEALWPDFEKAIGQIPKTTNSAKRSRPQPEILEELVDTVRSLDAKYRDSEDGLVLNRRRKMKYHPMMLREMMHQVGNGPGDPINILVLASFFRDDVPWVYELGRAAFNATQSGNPEGAREALEQFIRSMEMVFHGPMSMEEFGMDKGTYMMMREARHFLEEYTEFTASGPTKPVRLRKPPPLKKTP